MCGSELHIGGFISVALLQKARVSKAQWNSWSSPLQHKWMLCCNAIELLRDFMYCWTFQINEIADYARRQRKCICVCAITHKHTQSVSVGLYNKWALACPAIANYNDAGDAHPLLNNQAWLIHCWADPRLHFVCGRLWGELSLLTCVIYMHCNSLTICSLTLEALPLQMLI